MTEATRQTKPPRGQRILRRLWHVLIAGSFLAAFLTTDDSNFGNTHIVTGYLALGLLVLRIAVGIASPARSWLALPRPSLAALVRRGGERRGRPPVLAWMAIVMLLAVGASVVSGFGADSSKAVEALHGKLSDIALALATVHIAIVTLIFAG